MSSISAGLPRPASMEQIERIPSLVRTSISALERLTLALAEDSNFASESATSRSHFSKLKLWSGCLGAHRVTGTRSLIYRLRDASSIRKTVVFLLENLERYVKEAKSIAQQDSAERDNREDTEDITDEELAEYFCSNDNDESSDNAELKRILSQVEEVLDCLMRLAITIRHPAPFDQFRSRIGVVSVPYQWDIEHVQHNFPNIHPILSDRLGKALTQRRQYLTYRAEHHLRLQEGLNDDYEDGDGSKGKGTTIVSYVPHEPRSDAPTALEDTEDAFSETSTISYATTSADQGVPRIPPIPLEYGSGPFLCPFCRMLILIDAEEEWKARLDWKKHVFRDLRPYVCLEVQCMMASQDFQKRKDWMRHMLEEHWKVWTCPFECTLSFQTSNDAQNHTLEKHKAQISTERVEMLVSLSSNSDLTCAEGKCPLCLTFDIKNSRTYESHVGKHLEQLALFVLPQNGDDESEQHHDTQDDQDNNGQIGPEEEHISDMGSEIRSEEGEEEVAVAFRAEGFPHDNFPIEGENKLESEPEQLQPRDFADHATLANAASHPEANIWSYSFDKQQSSLPSASMRSGSVGSYSPPEPSHLRSSLSKSPEDQDEVAAAGLEKAREAEAPAIELLQGLEPELRFPFPFVTGFRPPSLQVRDPVQNPAVALKFGTNDFKSSDKRFSFFPEHSPVAAAPAWPTVGQSHATVSDGSETVEDSSNSIFPQGGHFSVSGVNFRPSGKPRLPIMVKDPNNPVAMKRARDILAARMSHERRGHKIKRLEKNTKKLEADSERMAPTQHDVNEVPSEPDVVSNEK